MLYSPLYVPFPIFSGMCHHVFYPLSIRYVPIYVQFDVLVRTCIGMPQNMLYSSSIPYGEL